MWLIGWFGGVAAPRADTSGSRPFSLAVPIMLYLRFDRDGRLRTACSLRHTYISLRLMGGDIYQIAKNCRTSVR